ncbi:MAG: copper resistance protein CopC [Chloroflexota bacterium]|nr:copper resistance protein CopC [Chloroflexota bacterium]
MRSLLTAASVALAAAIGLAGVASAHALLSSSDPAVGANLLTAPTAVTLTFTEAPDPRLSSIKVLDAAGASVTAGPAQAVAGAENALRVALKALPKGIYTVSWRTVSSVDGHTAAGSFAFGVGAAPPVGGESEAHAGGESSLSPVGVVGRWLLYAGLIVLLGAAFTGTVILAAPPLVSLILAAAGWLAALLGTVVVLADQLGGAGLGLGDVWGSSLGTSLLLRVVPLLAGGLVLTELLRRRRPTRPGLIALGLLAAAAMLADAVSSHAAASGAVVFNVAVQWIHVVAAGTWLGGLLTLLLALRGRPGEASATATRRFANSATVGIALVALTGVVRGLSEIGPWGNLVSTSFGWLLIAKSALLVALAGLGAVNHFGSVPAAGRSLRPLRMVGSTELAVGTVVLVLSASLVNLAPPAQAAAAATAPNVVATGADFGTTLRIRLTATPGTPGFNTFRATLTDYDTGAALTGRTVTLTFTLPARPDVGASQLKLTPSGDGVYQATGSNLSIEGAWRVTALIAGGGHSTEVVLQLTTRHVPPRIDVNAQPGQPTIYTVHFSSGETVQIYADPGTPGANEVHMTFFDTAGTELPVKTASMTIGLVGKTAREATLRLLEPGHFVADERLVAGTYAISVSGTPPNGTPLTVQLEVPIK